MYSEKKLLHLKQKEYKQGSLRTISLDTTAKCNMNCSHCYAETFAKVEPVDIDILKKALEETYDLGVHHYILQGGEPIVDKDRLERIINMLHPDEAYINVVSNGWAMTRDCIRWLKSLKVDKIAFSLDSGIEEEHDANRKKGSFRRVLEAIDNVIAEGLFTSISTVVTHESLYSKGFKAALGFARAKEIRMDVQIAMPVGRWDGKKEYLITPEDAKYIKKLQIECPILPNGQRMINRDVFNFGGKDHCPAGTEFMAITVDGNFLPCNFCQYTIGNIKAKSLNTMRNDLLKNKWFNSKHPICLLGEDDGFFEEYVMPYVSQEKPLDAYKIFGLLGG